MRVQDLQLADGPRVGDCVLSICVHVCDYRTRLVVHKDLQVLTNRVIMYIVLPFVIRINRTAFLTYTRSTLISAKEAKKSVVAPLTPTL